MTQSFPKKNIHKMPRPERKTAGRSPSHGSPQQPKSDFLHEAKQHNAEDLPSLLGIKPVLEFLQSTPERIDTVYLRKGRHEKELDTILDLCRKHKIRFSLLESTQFSRQIPVSCQGVAARLFDAGYVEVDTLLDSIMDAPLPLVLVLDQVKDPGNAGTLARTLFSLGGAGLIVPKHNSVYLGAAATKAAAGALNLLPVARAGSLSQVLDSAGKLGITIYGAAMDNLGHESIPVENIFSASLRLPALLVLGSEESGIRQNFIKRCHSLLAIPMLRDFDSLNVAQAGAICISAFLQTKLE